MILKFGIAGVRQLALAAGVIVVCCGAAAAQLSPNDTKATAQDFARPKGEGAVADRGGWRSACRPELKTVCRGAVGGSAKRRCLDANPAKQSPGCQSALIERRQKRAVALQACTTDLPKVCKDALATKGAKLQCLQTKIAEVTPDCSKALGELAAAVPHGKGMSKALAPKN